MIDKYLKILQEKEEILEEDFMRTAYSFALKMKDKALAKSLKQYKKTKKDLPPGVQKSLTRSEYELGGFWKALKALPKPVLVGSQLADVAVPGVPIGSLLVGIVYGTNKVFINKFSKASKQCEKVNKKNYKKKDKCILDTRIKLLKEKIKNLEKGKEFCDRAENKYTCLIKIRDIIEKSEKQLKKLERFK